MYSLLKTILKSIFPNSLLRRHQRLFREITYLFYKGKKFQCTVCTAYLSSFIQLGNKDLLCPRCGSLPRTRRLYDILTKNQFLNGKLLHFSPPFSLYQILSQNKNIQYISSDFEDEFLATKQYDLTNIEVPDNNFDFFIAYHVLEHIEDDLKAIKELYRITKNGGKGLIQTPFKTGLIYEDPTIQTEKDRLLHFGQKDHVRIYSVPALKNRLLSVGFEVKKLTFKENASNIFGFKTGETVLLVTK